MRLILVIAIVAMSALAAIGWSQYPRGTVSPPPFPVQTSTTTSVLNEQGSLTTPCTVWYGCGDFGQPDLAHGTNGGQSYLIMPAGGSNNNYFHWVNVSGGATRLNMTVDIQGNVSAGTKPTNTADVNLAWFNGFSQLNYFRMQFIEDSASNVSTWFCGDTSSSNGTIGYGVWNMSVTWSHTLSLMSCHIENGTTGLHAQDLATNSCNSISCDPGQINRAYIENQGGSDAIWLNYFTVDQQTPAPPVLFDALSRGDNNDCVAGSLTWSHTTSGSSRLLVVAISGTLSGATVTYNGLSMTQFKHVTDASAFQLHVYQQTGPAVGTHNIVVTPSSGSHVVWGVGMSFNGADASGVSSAVIAWATPGVPVASRNMVTNLTAGALAVAFDGALEDTLYNATSGQDLREMGFRFCTPVLKVKAWTSETRWMNWTYVPSSTDAVVIFAVNPVTSIVAPGVTTISITQVSVTRAVVTGRLDDYGTTPGGTQVIVGADSTPGSAQSCISNCGPFTVGTDSVPQTFVVQLFNLNNCTATTGWAFSTVTLPFAHGEGAHIGFTTGCPAQVLTGAADDIQTTSARFNGNLIVMQSGGNGTPACIRIFFQWGDTTALGNSTTLSQQCTTGPFSAQMYGLLVQNHTYYFRAVANGTDYQWYGVILNFTTQGTGSGGLSPYDATTIFNAICAFAFVLGLVVLLVGAYYIKGKREGGGL